MVEVSVPCGECTTPLRSGDERCDSCHSPVTPATKRALDERLAAYSPAFEKARRAAHVAAFLAPLVGFAHVLVGLLALAALGDDLSGFPPLRIGLSLEIIAGLVLGVSSFSSEARPLRSLMLSFALCVLTGASFTWLFPHSVYVDYRPFFGAASLYAGTLTVSAFGAVALYTASRLRADLVDRGRRSTTRLKP